MRCRAQHHDPRRPRREISDHRATIGAGGDVMHFVHDEDVERRVVDGRAHFGPLHQVERGDRDRYGFPRIDLRRQGRDGIVQRGLVQHRGGQRETLAHFSRPLVAQRRWREDQHAFRKTTGEQLADNQKRLDRLAETDGVREEDACGARDRRDGRLELPGAQLDPRARCRPWLRPRAGASNGGGRR